MYKRVISSTRAVVFYISPPFKCSFQNRLTPSLTNQPISQRSFASCSSRVRDGVRRFYSNSASRFNYFNGQKGGNTRRTAVGLGFSMSLLGFFEKKELTVEDQILMEMKRAILAIQKGEIKEAEGHLEKAWQMSSDEALEKAKTQILDIRANLAFQVGDLDAAEKLFKTVCQRLVYHQAVGVRENSIIEISIKLSQILALKGNYEDSISGFQYCAQTQREKIEKEGVDDEDTLLLAAWSLHSLAQAYLGRGTQGQMDLNLVRRASDLAKEAYIYASKAIGPDSQQALAINSDLASILALQGDVDAALAKYKECEALAAEKHTYLQPAIHVNTGTLYLQKGNYDEAERLCKEAKKLAKRYKDKESATRAEECIVRSTKLRDNK
ncbi:Tetratricopeptide repeat protein 19, mitochondrial [Orchesella cincta]|uniref:Tetratricopeptide repeat protein 19, mitochondrial n=1 Tax=Orchesella cincta TaxID=48709 RepID=A0A1D2MT69_ORCCI|nr:Tetratricopeptide repeat protein 19, mitochondrial [Orchesella cincta]